MSFGETGHADSETAAICMRAGFVKSADKFYQIDRMLKRVPRFNVSNASRPVATERENVSNGRLRVATQNRFDLPFVVANAGQVRDGIQLRCMLNALHKEGEIEAILRRYAKSAIG